MPIYQYNCSACETTWEYMASMTEDYENPPTHCSKCDPDLSGPPTLYKFIGNCRPAFDLRGEGFFKPGWN
jgi:putative FmdB family regulatory protein